MTAPTDSYSSPSGQILYGGMAAPTTYPAWRVGRTLNEWQAITNTSGGGGASLDEFSGLARVGTKLISAASGGHWLSDNRVTGIDLSTDVPGWNGTPGWAILNPPSANVDRTPDVSYYADGKPASRHTRFNIQWNPILQRVMLYGARDLFTAGSPGSQPTVDGFNLATGLWDVAGTYPNVFAVNGGAYTDTNGDGWVAGSKFTSSTKTWSFPLTATAPNGVRYPWATSISRNEIFGMCRGDGWGGTGVTALKQVGNVQTQITFNASAAYTQFQSDPAYEAGMSFDEVNGYYLFYAGNIGGQMYKITPNNTTVWDMSLFTYGAGSASIVVSIGGCQSKIHYIPTLKGFVLLPAVAGNLYFMPTSA